MKITAGIIALNASDTIKYTLDSIYDYVDQIIIVEGAVKDYVRVNPDMVDKIHSYSSVDNTFEILSDWYNKEKDLDNGKINIFCSGVYPFKNKSEMQNTILDMISDNTDLFLKIDADEVLDCKSYIQEIKKEFIDDQDLVMLQLNAHHFWKDLKHVTIGGQWDKPLAEIIRWDSNFRYSNTIKITDGFNILFNMKKIRYIQNCGTVKVFPEKCLYHLAYSHVRPEFVRAKLNYYKYRGIEENVIDTWSNWKPGESTSPTHIGDGEVIEFKGELPEVLKPPWEKPFHFA